MKQTPDFIVNVYADYVHGMALPGFVRRTAEDERQENERCRDSSPGLVIPYRIRIYVKPHVEALR
jgi:hypothetical protein